MKFKTLSKQINRNFEEPMMDIFELKLESILKTSPEEYVIDEDPNQGEWDDVGGLL